MALLCDYINLLHDAELPTGRIMALRGTLRSFLSVECQCLKAHIDHQVDEHNTISYLFDFEKLAFMFHLGFSPLSIDVNWIWRT